MKKNLAFLFIVAGFLSTISLHAQESSWTSMTNTKNIVTDKAVARASFPKEFTLFQLNIDPMRAQLFSAAGNSSKHSAIISLPNANGDIEEFQVSEASNFDAQLQARFPEIRAYSGKGITDKYATLKLSVSPQGIQTMVFRTEKENEFIEAYSEDHTVYAVYRSERKSGQLPWTCTTNDRQLVTDISQQVSGNITARSTGDLKTLRLAQSVTAEYSNYFGATSSAQVGLVLSAINATLTRCNGVYEKDLALHLNLINATTDVIYYNPATDPYDVASTGAGGTWNKQLMNTLHNVIGDDYFDIGHLFGASGGGGNAGCIGCVCSNNMTLSGGSPVSYKGSGFTSPADGIPQGDNFDIDYVVHEVGHQLGGNHTFSMSNEGTGVNKEIGSGITIMGYAGITSQDVAKHSIDIYHEATIAQIEANLSTKTCAITTSLAGTNATPVVSPMLNYTIPKSTPFALTGSATDADGDALTYCWEQNDNASSRQTGTSSVASPTKATGPNWLSFRPTVSPTRLFPQLSTILAGAQVTGPLPGGDAGANIEALSSVARTLNFRLTVRDNAAFSSTAPVSVGQTAFTDVVVTVSSASGPFAVTAPNTAVSYSGGSTQNVTWSVASTTALPVSCANVKITLSTDGGQTFPIVLAESTPNDGTAAVVIPNTATTTARIKVEAVGNIFFDICNTNFTITGGSSCATPSGLAATSITTSGATVSWTAVSGAVSYDVDYKLTSSGTWTNAATATTAKSIAINNLTSSTTYDWRVRTNCASGASVYASAQFTTASNAVCNAPSGLAASSITTSGATVSWTGVSGASGYAVDYKLNGVSTWTSATSGTTATSIALSNLNAGSLYDWRVRTNCSGSTSTYASSQFTTTAETNCSTAFEPNETPSAAAPTISLNTNYSAAIYPRGDVDNYKFTISTSGTITLTLSSLPANYDLKLLNSAGAQLGLAKKGGTSDESITYNAAAGTYYAQVYGVRNAYDATNCYTLNVATGTATRSELNMTTSSLKVYPNPAVSVINVNLTGMFKANSTLQIIDTKGAVVKVVNMLNSLQAIDISRLRKGVYIMRINNGKELITSRFEKQ